MNYENNEVFALGPMGQGLISNSPMYDFQNELSNRYKNDEDSNDKLPVTSKVIASIFLFASYAVFLSTFPISLLFCFRIAYEWERLVVFRLGKLMGNGAKGPGLYFILSCIDDYSVVDLRTISFEVPPQEVLTKDFVTISLDAVLFYRIWLPTIAVSNVYDYNLATQLLTSTTLRSVIGTKTLSEILIHREYISIDVRTILDTITKTWGVKVERVEIRDVRLPVNFQRSMAIETETLREARSKIIASDGEKRSAQSLRDAANILSTSRLALSLRFMQNLYIINQSKETQILYPIPLPMMSL